MTKSRREDYTCRSCRWWDRIPGDTYGECDRLKGIEGDQAFIAFGFGEAILKTLPSWGCLSWATLELMEKGNG